MEAPQKKKICSLIATICAAGFLAPVAAQTVTDVGVVRIVGEGDALGNGLMVDEDGTKARSTVTRAAIEKERPSANPFQLLNLMPGVNASSYDATGLFGGNLRVRGFNSDQMGFTINGAPVNDSGNFAVYPQEYTDSENLCELFITQGSVDNEAPHVGASGGNVGLVTCAPKDEFGGKFSLSMGDLNFRKTFVRLDTGLIGEQKNFKGFISVSNAYSDKFKGQGAARRDHLDLGFDWKLTADTKLSGSLLYNRAVNNNYLTLTKAEYNANPSLDFSSTVPQHLASGDESTVANFGTSSVGATPRTKLAYYGYSLNPFENALFTSRLQSRINEALTLSAEPYFWYGYGTGGTQQTTLSESTTGLNGGINDINKNGNKTDRVGVYRGSVTETYRPGVTFKADYIIENHKILAGLWAEQARHRQTAPATTVDNNGNVNDIWLRSGLLTYNNGATYENRDWNTISTAYSAFAQDTVNLGAWDVVPGLRFSSIERNFTNYASSGTGAGATYQDVRTYSKALPSIGARFKFDDIWQAFGNVSTNMRAPSNFVQSGQVTGGTYVGGVLTGYSLVPNTSIQPETSVTTEVGVRYGDSNFKASATLFNVDFRNRLAQGYNPDTNTYTDFNVGNSQIRGAELQIGTTPKGGWSYFGSLTYTESLIQDNFQATQTTSLPTSGAQFPDTPRLMAGASIQYTEGPFVAALSGKYVGRRYTTLVNDEYLDDYVVWDLSTGYRFTSTAFLKNPTIRLNISNLLDTRYLLANSGSGSNITTSTTAPSAQGGGYPTYYVGAPRFTSVTFSTDF